MKNKVKVIVFLSTIFLFGAFQNFTSYDSVSVTQKFLLPSGNNSDICAFIKGKIPKKGSHPGGTIEFINPTNDKLVLPFSSLCEIQLLSIKVSSALTLKFPSSLEINTQIIIADSSNITLSGGVISNRMLPVARGVLNDKISIVEQAENQNKFCQGENENDLKFLSKAYTILITRSHNIKIEKFKFNDTYKDVLNGKILYQQDGKDLMNFTKTCPARNLSLIQIKENSSNVRITHNHFSKNKFRTIYIPTSKGSNPSFPVNTIISNNNFDSKVCPYEKDGSCIGQNGSDDIQIGNGSNGDYNNPDWKISEYSYDNANKLLLDGLPHIRDQALDNNRIYEYRSNTQILNNVFTNSSGEAEIISIKTNGNVVKNNVFKNSSVGGLFLRAGSDNTVKNNVFWNTKYGVVVSGGHYKSASESQPIGNTITNNYFSTKEVPVILAKGTAYDIQNSLVIWVNAINTKIVRNCFSNNIKEKPIITWNSFDYLSANSNEYLPKGTVSYNSHSNLKPIVLNNRIDFSEIKKIPDCSGLPTSI